MSAHPKDYTVEGGDYWTFFLGGNVFPDLCSLETKGFPHLPGEQPLSLEQQMILARESSMRRFREPDIRSQVMFKRLEFLRSVRIEGDATLDSPRLHPWLWSTQIPAHLTTLEIVNCPRGFFEANITTLEALLQRSLTELPELRKLKFHTVDYTDPWREGPHHHLCDVVRKFGRKIPHLDLALPFVCAKIFAPQNITPFQGRDSRQALGPPLIAREPLGTLPYRIIDSGFRYRRLIRWTGSCSELYGNLEDELDDWDLMTASASAQGAEYSWEIIDHENNVASWHVGGHDTVHFSADDVLKQPY